MPEDQCNEGADVARLAFGGPAAQGKEVHQA